MNDARRHARPASRRLQQLGQPVETRAEPSCARARSRPSAMHQIALNTFNPKAPTHVATTSCFHNAMVGLLWHRAAWSACFGWSKDALGSRAGSQLPPSLQALGSCCGPYMSALSGVAQSNSKCGSCPAPRNLRRCDSVQWDVLHHVRTSRERPHASMEHLRKQLLHPREASEVGSKARPGRWRTMAQTQPSYFHSCAACGQRRWSANMDEARDKATLGALGGPGRALANKMHPNIVMHAAVKCRTSSLTSRGNANARARIQAAKYIEGATSRRCGT